MDLQFHNVKLYCFRVYYSLLLIKKINHFYVQCHVMYNVNYFQKNKRKYHIEKGNRLENHN